MLVAVKQTISASVTVSAVHSKLSRTIETQTEDPAQISPKAQAVQSRTIETQTEDKEVSRETQTEPVAGKKRQLSQQAATGSKSKKRFEDLTEAEFLAGDDGAISDSPPQNAIDDEAIREMIKSFHQNNLPDVPEPVKQTAKGKQKKK